MSEWAESRVRDSLPLPRVTRTAAVPPRAQWSLCLHHAEMSDLQQQPCDHHQLRNQNRKRARSVIVYSCYAVNAMLCYTPSNSSYTVDKRDARAIGSEYTAMKCLARSSLHGWSCVLLIGKCYVMGTGSYVHSIWRLAELTEREIAGKRVWTMQYHACHTRTCN